MPMDGHGLGAQEPRYPERKGRERSGTETGRKDETAVALQSLALATTALAESSKRSRENKPSVYQFKIHNSLPKLDDEGQYKRDPKKFYREFRGVCDMANDGQGMSYVDMCKALRSQCSGNKQAIYDRAEKVYRNQRGDRLDDYAKELFEHVEDKHMEYQETLRQKQDRLQKEFNQLTKGKKTAMEFLTPFEDLLEELLDVDMGKTPAAAFQSYLEKIGHARRTEVLKDKRPYRKDGADSFEMRQPRTWREAHEVLKEIEANESNIRTYGEGHGQRAYPMEGGGGSDNKKVCFQMARTGQCSFGKECFYDHSKAALAKYRADNASKCEAHVLATKGGKGGRGRSRGGKGKGKSGGRKGGDGGGDGRQRGRSRQGQRTQSRPRSASRGKGKGKGKGKRARSASAHQGGGGGGGGGGQPADGKKYLVCKFKWHDGECPNGQGCQYSHKVEKFDKNGRLLACFKDQIPQGARSAPVQKVKKDSGDGEKQKPKASAKKKGKKGANGGGNNNALRESVGKPVGAGNAETLSVSSGVIRHTVNKGTDSEWDAVDPFKVEQESIEKQLADARKEAQELAGLMRKENTKLMGKKQASVTEGSSASFVNLTTDEAYKSKVSEDYVKGCDKFKELKQVIAKLKTSVQREVNSLKDLPKDVWTRVPNRTYGYQYISCVQVAGLPNYDVETLLDGCAGVNTVTEELIVGILNTASRKGIKMSDKNHPIAELENWDEPEKVHGINAKSSSRLLGSAILRVRFKDMSSDRERIKMIRFKIMESNSSSWHGLIIGGRALDCEARGGLGFRPERDHHWLDSLRVRLPRLEDSDVYQEKRVLAFRDSLMDQREIPRSCMDEESEGNESLPDPAASDPSDTAETASVSEVESDLEDYQVSSAKRYAVFLSETKKIQKKSAVKGFDVLALDVPGGMTLEGGEGAFVPVRRISVSGNRPRETDVEAVHQAKGTAISMAPGLWKTGAVDGVILITNPLSSDVGVEDGEVLGVVCKSATRSIRCVSCGYTDTESWPVCEDSEVCAECDTYLPPEEFLPCGSCGHNQPPMVLSYSSCGSCGTSPGSRFTRGGVKKSRRKRPREYAVASARFEVRASRDPDAPARQEIYHIVEEPGGIDWMNEVETPAEEYYELLRKHLDEMFPGADKHVKDHVLSLEAFLDKAIISGFSFGCEKAQVLIIKGKLLGHWIGREGASADPERVQAIMDFAPLKEKKHVQQFLGCTNWLRIYFASCYANAAKVLGALQKEGAEFPPKGVGLGDAVEDKAFRAIKIIAKYRIHLEVLDEAAAVDGSRPLEQVADCSGIAWGGTIVQMRADLSGLKILVMVGKGLLTSQQAWPPLQLEGYAQLETKRAQRRTLGTLRSWCWCDHANVVRQATTLEIDVKTLRVVSEITSDGSVIRSLSGRSATLGDSTSRNPRDRDALIERRTGDLQDISRQLRSFDVEQFLAEHEDSEGRYPVPWTLPSDSLPTKPKDMLDWEKPRDKKGVPKYVKGPGQELPVVEQLDQKVKCLQTPRSDLGITWKQVVRIVVQDQENGKILLDRNVEKVAEKDFPSLLTVEQGMDILTHFYYRPVEELSKAFPIKDEEVSEDETEDRDFRYEPEENAETQDAPWQVMSGSEVMLARGPSPLMTRAQMRERDFGAKLYKELQDATPQLRGLHAVMRVLPIMMKFVMPERGGPSIEMMVFRKTWDYKTNEVLEERWIRRTDKKEDLTGLLPPPVPRKTRTFIFYRVVDPMERAMVNTVGEGPVFKILYAPDYETDAVIAMKCRALSARLQTWMPDRRVVLQRSYGPFEDGEGDKSYVDGDKMHLAPAKLMLAIRRDLLTSIIKVLRDAVAVKADCIIGEGQGGLIALLVAHPRIVEQCLALRTVQREEERLIATAWGNIRAVVVHESRMSKTHPKKFSAELLKSALPWVSEKGPIDPVRRIVIRSTSATQDKFDKELGKLVEVLEMKDYSDILWSQITSSRPHLMWEHNGTCACGRKVHLFGQCYQCTREELAREMNKREDHLEQQGQEKPGALGELAAPPEVAAVALLPKVDPDLVERYSGRNSSKVVHVHPKALEPTLTAPSVGRNRWRTLKVGNDYDMRGVAVQFATYEVAKDSSLALHEEMTGSPNWPLRMIMVHCAANGWFLIQPCVAEKFCSPTEVWMDQDTLLVQKYEVFGPRHGELRKIRREERPRFYVEDWEHAPYDHMRTHRQTFIRKGGERIEDREWNRVRKDSEGRMELPTRPSGTVTVLRHSAPCVMDLVGMALGWGAPVRVCTEKAMQDANSRGLVSKLLLGQTKGMLVLGGKSSSDASFRRAALAACTDKALYAHSVKSCKVWTWLIFESGGRWSDEDTEGDAFKVMLAAPVLSKQLKVIVLRSDTKWLVFDRTGKLGSAPNDYHFAQEQEKFLVERPRTEVNVVDDFADEKSPPPANEGRVAAWKAAVRGDGEGGPAPYEVYPFGPGPSDPDPSATQGLGRVAKFHATKDREHPVAYSIPPKEKLYEEKIDGQLKEDPIVEKTWSRRNKEREERREEIEESTGYKDWKPGSSLRIDWCRAQRMDPNLAEFFRKDAKLPSDAYRVAEDGLLERLVGVKSMGPRWVAFVPDGDAAPGLSWRRWCFLECHTGLISGHRLVDQTLELLQRSVYWEKMKEDVTFWVSKCVTCIRFRQRPRKNFQLPAKKADVEPWEEIMCDLEGPHEPGDKEGNKYVFTYMCCMCHGVMLEPVKHLTASEVRGAFARALFRSGTLPTILRTDNGPEFVNALFAEFCALIGLKHKLGGKYRPMEQGDVERVHIEKQKLLGIVLLDVLEAGPEHWSEVLPVVEFLLYNTPGQFGITPRDLDRRWSFALPLEKELKPFVVGDFENTTEYSKQLFKQYRDIRTKVRSWQAKASEQSAARANRHRRPKELVKGKMVVYKDPRVKAAGGRAHWKEPLTSPCIIEEVLKGGTKCHLRMPDGTLLKTCHIDDILLLPDNVLDLEHRSRKKPIEFEKDQDITVRKSIGELFEEEPEEIPEGITKRGGKALERVRPGMTIAYRSEPKSMRIRIGMVQHVVVANARFTVQRYRPLHDGRMRIKWIPVFIVEGAEVLGAGGQPCTEAVPVTEFVMVVPLKSGVLGAAAARYLDGKGFLLDEGEAQIAEDLDDPRVVEQEAVEDQRQERFPEEDEFPPFDVPEPVAVVSSFSLQRRFDANQKAATMLEELVMNARVVLVAPGIDGPMVNGSRPVMFDDHAVLQKYLGLGYVDFLEIYCGYGMLTLMISEAGVRAGEGIDNKTLAYGQVWQLDEPETKKEFAWLMVFGLKPRATHTGTPCTNMCILGKRQGGSTTNALVKLTGDIGRHQVAMRCLHSNEQPKGSMLTDLDEWKVVYGPLDRPKAPWRYFDFDGCMLGMTYPGIDDLGRPMRKSQYWCANYDLEPMSLQCRNGGRLAAAETGHEHRHVRGGAKLPSGKWISVATYSGAYPKEVASVYARCVLRALAEQAIPRELYDVQLAGVTTNLKKLALSHAEAKKGHDKKPFKRTVAADWKMDPDYHKQPVYLIDRGHHVMIVPKPKDEDEEVPEPPSNVKEFGGPPALDFKESERQRKILEDAGAKARAGWLEAAKKGRWNLVKTDMEVYLHSGEEVTADPRVSEEYRDKVIDQLGFGKDWKEKRPFLTEEDVEVARYVLRRKAAAFWVEGTPRTTVRKVAHDTIPTGPPCRTPPHNLKGELAQWVDDKLEDEVKRGQLIRGNSPWGSPPFPTKEMPSHKAKRKRRLVVDYRRVNARTLRAVYFVRKASDVSSDAMGSVFLTLLDAVTGFNQLVNTE